jgi:hypothetical protein
LQVSFYPPILNGRVGGLNLDRKYAVIDASRLGSQTAVEVNMPPIDIPIINPVQVSVKPPGQQIIDLSSFGAEDTTVVQLPNYQVKLPTPVKVIPEPGHVHVINLAAAQTGPVYEIQLPGLPQSNNIDITLPKVNFTGVTLPGEAPLSCPCFGWVALSDWPWIKGSRGGQGLGRVADCCCCASADTARARPPLLLPPNPLPPPESPPRTKHATPAAAAAPQATATRTCSSSTCRRRTCRRTTPSRSTSTSRARSSPTTPCRSR